MPLRNSEPAGAGSRFRVRISGAPLLFACMLLASMPGRAATPVYADIAMACAGLTPCYSSIQEAVDNAGPAPAFVGVFPGTYAESVDLSTMGSAIGGGPGDITIQALDAAGQPAASGVLVDPGASGGPGAGAGIISGLADVFTGDVTIRGLALTSPDIAGLGLQVVGDVIVEDFLLEGAGTSGGFISVDGDVMIARGVARLNGSAGIGAGASGMLVAEDISAVRNIDTGVILGGTSVVANRVDASLNLDGTLIFACESLELNDITAESNDTQGISILAGEENCDLTTSNKLVGVAPAVPGWPALPFEFEGRFKQVPPGFVLGADTMTVTDNGEIGIIMLATGVAVELRNLAVSGNEGGGMFGEAGTIVMADSEFSGNHLGAFLQGEEVQLSGITANNNGLGPVVGLFDHTGILVASENATLSDLVAENNPRFGLLFGETQDAMASTFEILDGRFNGNSQGLVTISQIGVDVLIDQVDAIDNTAGGIVLPDIQNATITRTTVQGSPLGLALNVAEQLVVEQAEVNGNETGFLMVVSPGAQARINCSNVRDNLDYGVQLTQGEFIDARFNFWGAASGPTHPGNPGGTGDVVGDSATGDDGSVDYVDYLPQPATAEDCPVVAPPPQSIPASGGAAGWLLILGMALVALVSTGTFRRSR